MAAVVSGAVRAFMGWQLAAHWGNRRFARPRPRPEVLAAALLAPWGDDAPFLKPDSSRGSGLPACEAAVVRAATFSRYAALLLAVRRADRVAGADVGTPAVGLPGEEMAHRASTVRAQLEGDPRYRNLLDGAGLATNLALLAAWEGVVDGLCAAAPGRFSVWAPERGGALVEVTLEPAGERSFRVRPWPLAGPRLDLQGEGRRPGGPEGAAPGTVERLTFTLLRPAGRS